MSVGGVTVVSNGPLIEVVGASKSFILRRERTTALRDRFSLSRFRRSTTDEFWAVRDVSFAVSPGQSIGIVGHNGSGKSTMLKLLTGILKPTQGSVSIHGRVAALIEVGAGFHPDLTGRENIFLNGSILGLSRREISAKFDDIVAFADLERFIDTPVKRYSSGMYMRLGFSIAVHTEPQILLVDEVLAVGDAMFQRRCLKRLEKFVAGGGAAVFVSHSMAQVAELCNTCVWLDHGEARYIGQTQAAIDQYMAVVSEREDAEFQRQHPEEWAALEAARATEAEAERSLEQSEATDRDTVRAGEQQRAAAFDGDPTRVRILGVTLRDGRGHSVRRLALGQAARIDIDYHFGRIVSNPIFGIDFFRVSDGLHMFTTSNYDHRFWLKDLPATGTLSLDIDCMVFNEGAYRVQVNLFPDCAAPKWFDTPEHVVPDALRFEVDAGRFANGCTYLATHWLRPVGDPAANEGIDARPVTMSAASTEALV